MSEEGGENPGDPSQHLNPPPPLTLRTSTPEEPSAPELESPTETTIEPALEEENYPFAKNNQI